MKYVSSVRMNQLVTFILRGKKMKGKVVTIGDSRTVNVISNGKYYFCSDYSRVNDLYREASQINKSDIETTKR